MVDKGKSERIAEAPVRRILLGDIEKGPGPYCMSFGYDLQPLLGSIKAVGLMNSPVLREDRGGALRVIAGYRRIHALRSLEYGEVLCRVLPESQFTALDALLYNFHDNLATRRFNDVEKGMVLKHLSEWLPEDQIIEEHMPLLNLPSHRPTLSLYIELEARLEDEVKVDLARGNVALRTARMLLEMDRRTRMSVFRILSNLMFNVNQQLQFIDYVTDIAKIEKKGVPELLEDPVLVELCTGDRTNRPQRTKAVLNFLRSRRLPTLKQAERRFHETVGSLNLPEGVSIKAPPFFEASQYRLEVLFETGEELRRKIVHLVETEGLLALGDPWREKP